MAKAELGGVEVKKKRYLVMTVAAVLIMAAVAASAYVLQKKRETPEDRALRKSSEAASEETDSEASGNKTGEKISEKEGVGDNVLMSGAVKIELLSAEIVKTKAVLLTITGLGGIACCEKLCSDLGC